MYLRHRRIVDNWLHKPLQCLHAPVSRCVHSVHNASADVGMRRLIMNDDDNMAYPSEMSNEVRVFDSAHAVMQRALTLPDDTDNRIGCLVYCVQLGAYITTHKDGRVRVWQVGAVPTVRDQCDTHGVSEISVK